ncbi:carotenoid oxygenase family protein [Actinokineospora sp. HBU206404]|uniref:Dioxygenase n=1 Tax=Actinokineospora xionganensis TaxID=2684470 RepID=A0ABR7L4Y8_9PSEU|nr:carotenoid oxygenase family protein [Actinokineospora xionganensis]
MVNRRNAGRPYRYTFAATGEPGWCLFDGFVEHDLLTGRAGRHRYGAGCSAVRTAFAARTGSQGEDDGYLITMTTDMNADRCECRVFDARRVTDGGPAQA